jgi:hypothetical protein
MLRRQRKLSVSLCVFVRRFKRMILMFPRDIIKFLLFLYWYEKEGLMVVYNR